MAMPFGPITEYGAKPAVNTPQKTDVYDLDLVLTSVKAQVPQYNQYSI